MYTKEQAKEYRINHRTRHVVHSKRYREIHRDRVNNYVREYVQKNLEKVRIYRKKYQKKYLSIPENKIKTSARRKLYWAIKTKRVVKGKCDVCGSTKVQAHHNDYSKPLDVRWLCYKHHKSLHFSVEALPLMP